MSLNGLLNIARGGIAAQAAGLQITGENIGNVSTPGYAKRSVVLETTSPGLGVHALTSTRAGSAFSMSQVLAEASKLSSSEARAQRLAGAEGILAPEAGGLSERVDNFFAAMTAVSVRPSEPASRMAALSQAEMFAAGVRDAAQGIATTRQDILGDARTLVAEVNERTTQIAKLNEGIRRARATGDDASSLEDSRDVLAREVIDRVGGRSLAGQDGQLSLLVGGIALVDGGSASALQLDVGIDDSMRLGVLRGSGPMSLRGDAIGGSYAGLREVRDEDLVALTAELDTFAFEFGTRVNAVHSAGVGTDGVGGRALFTPSATVAGAAMTMRLDAAMTSGSALAASSAIGMLPAGGDNALALVALHDAPGAGGTLGALASAPALRAGLLRAAADREVDTRRQTVLQAETHHASLSGVSLEEEMINLSTFQRAFQAQSKLLQTADDLMRDLLQSI
jgi:flagellar hook-associated protein 1